MSHGKAVRGPGMQLKSGPARKLDKMKILVADDDSLDAAFACKKHWSTRVTKWLPSKTGAPPWSVSPAKTVRDWRCWIG